MDKLDKIDSNYEGLKHRLHIAITKLASRLRAQEPQSRYELISLATALENALAEQKNITRMEKLRRAKKAARKKSPETESE